MNTRSINDELESPEEIVYFKPTKENYKDNKKYYANISFKKFKKLYKSNKISTVAIIDSKSDVSNMFIKMINKMAYYKSTKIYILQINKLSRKDEISFYNMDEQLGKIDSNYIITVSGSNIISVTTFDEERINAIEKELGE